MGEESLTMAVRKSIVLYEDQWNELRQPLVECLTGGNHLASVLINRLGCDEKDFPPYTSPLDPDAAQKAGILLGENWDLWVAWRGIMRFRDALKEAKLMD